MNNLIHLSDFKKGENEISIFQYLKEEAIIGINTSNSKLDYNAVN